MEGNNLTQTLIPVDNRADLFKLRHIRETLLSLWSKRAVLKLSWTPVKRLPEGAVYEVLHRSGISGIPEVYDTELIREDFYGYRLEYIILEHCGDSIEAYIRDSRNRRDTESEIHINVEQFINQVTSCIVDFFL
ncbi:hypothetical protein GGH99_001402 [Coemansia sp. RSA 1285]|nr:hypothetical protein GGH99_001402 [Coemansia sp. RSA 1285]